MSVEWLGIALRVAPSLFAPLAEYAISPEFGSEARPSAHGAAIAAPVAVAVAVAAPATSTTSRYQAAVVDYVERECGPLLREAPAGADWQIVLDKGNALQVWRRPVTGSFMYEYALRGKSVAPPSTFIRYAWLDLDARKQWDTSCGASRSLAYDASTLVESVYWESVYPWPVWPRDYVYQRATVVAAAEAHGVSWVGVSPVPALIDSAPPLPADAPAPLPGKVRVQRYSAAIIARAAAAGEHGCRWAIRVFDDPEVAVPQAVVSAISRASLPLSAANLERACERAVRSEEPAGR